MKMAIKTVDGIVAFVVLGWVIGMIVLGSPAAANDHIETEAARYICTPEYSVSFVREGDVWVEADFDGGNVTLVRDEIGEYHATMSGHPDFSALCRGVGVNVHEHPGAQGELCFSKSTPELFIWSDNKLRFSIADAETYFDPDSRHDIYSAWGSCTPGE